jgi:hypothetical protein
MVRFYIAADSHLWEEVKKLRDELVLNLNLACTARWIDVELEAFYPITEAELETAAMGNFNDIDRAHFLIVYNPVSRHKSGTGGRHVELGYALARYKAVFYVGEKLENVFHRHPGVRWTVDHSLDQVSFVAEVLAAAMLNVWRDGSVRPSER